MNSECEINTVKCNHKLWIQSFTCLGRITNRAAVNTVSITAKLYYVCTSKMIYVQYQV